MSLYWERHAADRLPWKLLATDLVDLSIALLSKHLIAALIAARTPVLHQMCCQQLKLNMAYSHMLLKQVMFAAM